MTKLEELTKNIYIKIPSLTHLTFGCEVRIINGDIKGIIVGRNSAGNYIINIGKTGNYTFKLTKIDLIGHPIQLNHVLIALGYHKQAEERYHVTTYGSIKDNFGDEYVYYNRKQIIWDFNVPLSKQNIDTIEYLHQVICS